MIFPGIVLISIQPLKPNKETPKQFKMACLLLQLNPEIVMFKNYIKVALVNLRKHKAFSFINIIGLAIGIACCILITIYVFHELSYDRYHAKADRIFRLHSDLKFSGDHLIIPKSSPPTGKYLVENYPEVLSAVQFRGPMRLPIRHRDKLFYINRFFFADNSVFDIFDFPLIKGDPRTALTTASTCVITESTAKKYFGDESPLGKVLHVNNHWDLTVTGVVKNVPRNSHFGFDMLCSFETYAQENKRDMQNWLFINNYTYILLQKGYDHKHLEQKLPEMVEKNIGPMLKYVKGEYQLTLMPLTQIHLHSNLMQEISGNSDIVYVYIFSVITFFILAIACINFMNLSTARSANRAREVGLRKVLGANRGKIIVQFLAESVFTSLIALIIGLLLLELALPLFRSLSGVELSINYTASPWLIPSLIAMAVFIGLAAGSYPAFFLSSYQPVRVLKGLKVSECAGYRAIHNICSLDRGHDHCLQSAQLHKEQAPRFSERTGCRHPYQR
jgi:putative ABC transport system permease protein